MNEQLDLDHLERLSVRRREVTDPKNIPGVSIDCDSLDCLVAELRAARAQIAQQQAELEVARKVLREANDVMYLARHVAQYDQILDLCPELMEAVEAYDAARARQEES